MLENVKLSPNIFSESVLPKGQEYTDKISRVGRVGEECLN